MHILYINDVNGVAETFSEELIQRGHSTFLYKPNQDGGFASLPRKIVMIPKRLFDLRRAVKELRSSRFDLAHIHWASYSIVGLASRIPFIIECHGTDVRDRLKNPFFRVLLYFSFQRAAAVLCITPDILPIVQTIYPKARFFPGPIDTNFFVPQHECLNTPRPWTILLFARLDRVKGCETTVQGIVSFTKHHPEVHVKLLEWGPEKDFYKDLFGNMFEFIPRVAPCLVRSLLQSADVVVGQVFLGALGLSELQAMSCAKPVVASFNYDNTYTTPPPLCQATTAQEVDAQLEYLFQHPDEAKALGQLARQWVIEHHSNQALAKQLEYLYQTIIRV